MYFLELHAISRALFASSVLISVSFLAFFLDSAEGLKFRWFYNNIPSRSVSGQAPAVSNLEYDPLTRGFTFPGPFYSPNARLFQNFTMELGLLDRKGLPFSDKQTFYMVGLMLVPEDMIKNDTYNAQLDSWSHGISSLPEGVTILSIGPRGAAVPFGNFAYNLGSVRQNVTVFVPSTRVTVTNSAFEFLNKSVKLARSRKSLVLPPMCLYHDDLSRCRSTSCVAKILLWSPKERGFLSWDNSIYVHHSTYNLVPLKICLKPQIQSPSLTFQKLALMYGTEEPCPICLKELVPNVPSERIPSISNFTSVSLESYYTADRLYATECDHVFHRGCIKAWIHRYAERYSQEKVPCPICRHPLSVRDYMHY